MKRMVKIRRTKHGRFDMHLGYWIGTTGLAMNRPLCRPLQADETAYLNSGIDTATRASQAFLEKLSEMAEEERQNDPFGFYFDPFGLFKPLRIALGFAKTGRDGDR